MIRKIGELQIQVESGTVLNRIRAEEETWTTRGMKVLTPRAISEGIDPSEMEDILIEQKLFDEQRVKTTMISDVILKLSTPYDAAYISKGYDGLVIPSYFAVLRVSGMKEIDPRYLTYVLNSTYVRHYLASVTTGASSAMIKMKDVISIPIPMLSIEEQGLLGDIYTAFCQKRASMMKMYECEKAFMDATLINAIRKEV